MTPYPEWSMVLVASRFGAVFSSAGTRDLVNSYKIPVNTGSKTFRLLKKMKRNFIFEQTVTQSTHPINKRMWPSTRRILKFGMVHQNPELNPWSGLWSDLKRAVNELCIYIALYVYCCTPKMLHNHVGGGGLILNHHQCAASSLDDATAATGQWRQCAHHTPATGGEKR